MNQLHLTLEVAPTAQCSELDPAIHDEALVQKAQAGDAESIDCLLCMYLTDFRRRARCACGGDLAAAAAQLARPQRPSAIFMLAHYERLHEFPTVRVIAQATHCSQGAAQLYRRANLASWRHLLTASQGAVL